MIDFESYQNLILVIKSKLYLINFIFIIIMNSKYNLIKWLNKNYAL